MAENEEKPPEKEVRMLPRKAWDGESLIYQTEEPQLIPLREPPMPQCEYNLSGGIPIDRCPKDATRTEDGEYYCEEHAAEMFDD